MRARPARRGHHLHRADGLAHVDPDVDQEPLPPPALRWRGLLESAGAVLFCTPEYDGALPGAFKNALDWLVGCTVMTDRPVALVTVAADPSRGGGARAEPGAPR